MNSLDGYRVLCGLAEPMQAETAAALPPFAPQVTNYLADLSIALLHDKAALEYPEVSAFAFFCRRASLQSMQAAYDDLDVRLGRGMVFHIAPGNVPMNFAYSLVAALLAGNASIVKAPSKAFAQVVITCKAMQALLDDQHKALKPYINVIEYSRERQDITQAFSSHCDARVIWGGDETICRVRQAELPPRTFDITFADRWSLAILDAGAILRMRGREVTELAKGFYNDTYLYDQNACTAPRLCVWMGESSVLEKAKGRFWDSVYAQTVARYPLDAVTVVDKQIEFFRAAMLLDGAQKVQTKDNYILRIRLQHLLPKIMDIRCKGGCFLEYDAADIAVIAPILTLRLQTIACFGVEPSAIRSLVIGTGAKGADRIVQVGHTMDFSLVWDGYDLIRSLSRKLG